MKQPLISICIPAYKNTVYLERLLNSITGQSFTNYEVIVTDDSPDTSVEAFLKSYTKISNLRYVRNPVALGTPENWNEGIRQATGTWVKLMHDDDWFTHNEALARYVNAIENNPGTAFFFAAYQNVEQESGQTEVVRLSASGKLMLQLSRLHLFKKNYVGNPSCTLIKKDINLFYDNKLKWVVDFEYYLRCLRQQPRFHYINEPLISVGINKEQVTKYTFRVASVEIPESYYMIDKMGYGILRNLFVYDYYWRLNRNLNMRSIADVQQYYPHPVHPLLKQMVLFQKRVPASALKNGVISKALMLFNYGISLFRSARQLN